MSKASTVSKSQLNKTPKSNTNLSKKDLAKKPTYIEFLNKTGYPWLEKKIGYKRKKDFQPIDFNKHWINLYKPIWWVLLLDGGTSTLYSLMFTYWPLVIFWGVANNPGVIVLYAIAQIFVALLGAITSFVYSGAMEDLTTNFNVSVTEFFLTSDPIHHSTKSSGKITSKVSRATSALEPLAAGLSYNVVPTIIELGSIAVGFFTIGPLFGLYTSSVFLFITLVLIVSRRFLFSPILKWSYAYRDALNGTALEILQQQNFIRTVMASDIMMNKFSQMSKKIISVMTTRRNAQTIYFNFFRVTWLVSLIFLLLMLFNRGLLNQDNQIVLGLVVAYITNAGNVNRIGNMITMIFERATEIDDLYEYIDEFGANTYPVITHKNLNK